MKIFLICGLSLFMICCKKTITYPEKYVYAWPVLSDSMNLAIMIVESEKYALEGGYFSRYERCNHCETDSLPFDITIFGAHNFDIMTFEYSQTGDTILIFHTYLDNSHPHTIIYPEIFYPPEIYEIKNNHVQLPSSVEYFGYLTGIDESTLSLKTDSVWSVIDNLDIVNDYGQDDFQAGFFFFPQSSDMNSAKWLVFLCR